MALARRNRRNPMEGEPEVDAPAYARMAEPEAPAKENEGNGPLYFLLVAGGLAAAWYWWSSKSAQPSEAVETDDEKETEEDEEPPTPEQQPSAPAAPRATAPGRTFEPFRPRVSVAPESPDPRTAIPGTRLDTRPSFMRK